MDITGYLSRFIQTGRTFTVKSALLFFLLLSGTTHLYSQHGWSVNPADYEYNGEISAVVIMSASEVSTGTLGAFVGEECRGFIDADYFPPTGRYLFTIMCYSNESVGEVMSFKYYNPSDGLIYDIDETHEFEAISIPDRINPYEFHVSTAEPPVVADIPGQTINEGSTFTTINLDNYVSDPDNPDSEISWEATGQSELTVSIVSRVATITIPDAEWYGSEVITFTATDPDLLSDSDAATFTVNAVNDAPGFTGGADETVLEDAGLQTVPSWATNISAGPANESTQALTFNVSNDNNALFSVQPAIASNGTLTYTPAVNANGSATVTVTLQDNGGTANGGDDTSDPQYFTITVTAVNDAPSFTAGLDQLISEDDDTQTLPNWATAITAGPANESTQTLAFQVSNNNNALFSTQPAISSTGTLTYTPAENASGTATVTVALQDNGGTANGGDDTSDPQYFTITVVPVNDAPVVGDIPNQSVPEGGSFTTITLDNYVSDVDNTDAEMTWSYSGNSQLSVSIINRIATVSIPSASWSGSETITFTAEDPNLASDSDAATFTVSAVNDPPIVSDIPNQTIDEGGTFATIHLDDYVEDAEDPDEDIVWSYSGNDELSVSILNRVATVSTPDADWNGLETITFTATDQDGLSNSDDATFRVTPVNDDPVVADIPDQTVDEGASFTTITLDNYVTDVDNADNEITWTWSGNSELGVSITNRIATITIPDVDWNGAETITFTATDPGLLSDSDPAAFTVTAVNDAPVVTDIPDQTIPEGGSFTTISLDGYVSDVDNADSEITWTFSGNTDLVVSITNRIATITVPDADWNGAETITFTATDPGLLPDSDPATFTVTAVNDPPVVSDIPDQSVNEGTPFNTISLDNYVTDPDHADNQISWTYSGNTDLVVSITNRIATISVPDAEWQGSEVITFIATDPGLLSDSDPATFTVTADNDPPVVSDIPDQTILEGASFTTITLDNYVTDPDNADSQINWTFSGNDDLDVSITNRVATISIPNQNWNGAETITFTATDPGLLSDSDAALFTVSAVNDPPEFTAGSNQTVLEDAGAQSVTNWATGISTGPSNEASQTLTFLVSNNNNTLFSVQPAISSTGTLTYTPAANANGTATVTVTLQDNGGTDNGGDDTSDPKTFTITVTAVNDAPSFTPGGNQSVLEDAGVQTVTNWATAISAGPSNEAAQTLTFQVSNNNNTLFSAQPAVSSTGTLTYTPAANANGSATVTVTLQDNGGTANGGDDSTDPQTFTITVTAVNDAPSFTEGGNQTVLEDSGPRTVTNWATAISAGPANEASQTLSFLVTNNNNALFSTQPAISPTGTLTYTPAADANGSATVTVTLTDNGGVAYGGDNTSDPQSFTITVNAVNDPPSFTAGGNQTVEEDAGPQSVANWATNISAGPDDEASQTLTFVVSNNNNALFSMQPSVSSAGTLTYTPAANSNGAATVTVTLRDNGGTVNGGDDSSDPQSFTITVTAVNDSPVVTDIPNQTINEGQSFASITLDNYVTDPDNADSEITWTFSGAGELNVSITNRIATISAPNPNWYGTATITFTGTDPGLLSDSDAAIFTVNPVNDPPEFIAGGNLTVLEDAGAQNMLNWATSISPGPSNEASQTLTFLVSNNNNALFSVQPAVSSAGTLTYTPTANANGTATVTVALQDDGGTANGGDDTSDPQTFTITVTPVNDVPSFTKGANQTVTEDSDPTTVLNWATAISAGPSNEASQTLTFNLFNNNATLFSAQPAISSTGTLTFTPASNAYGTATVTVTLQDNGGTANGGNDTSDPQTFIITVTAVNDAPVLDNPIEDQVLDEHFGTTTLSLSGVFSDPDGTTPTLSASSGNASVVTVSISGTTLTITETGLGQSTITVTASDGTLTASDNFLVTVNNVNDPPVVDNPIADRSLNEHFETDFVNLSGVFSDPDEDELMLSAISNNTGVVTVSISGNTLTITEIGLGLATITVTANDGEFTANDAFQVTVNNVNDPPVVINPVADRTYEEYFSTRNINISDVFFDPDADDLTLTATSSDNEVVTVSISGNTLTVTETGLGISTITLSAFDGEFTRSDYFTVTVLDVNEPPVVDDPILDDIIDEGFGSFTIDLSTVFSDPDAGDDLTYSALSSATGVVSVSISGSILTVTEEGLGTADITVTASDGEFSASDLFKVSVNDVNLPPVMNCPATVYLTEGFGTHTISISTLVTDPDGDPLTITVTSSNTSVVTVTKTATTIVIHEVGNGTATINLTASDGINPPGSCSFTVDVNNINDAPVVTDPVEDFDLNENFGTYTIDLEDVFTDPDNDPMTFVAMSGNTNVVTVSVSGSILTITEQGNGSSDITVTASDAEYDTDDLFTLTVLNVNEPPVVVAPLEDLTLDEHFGIRTIDLLPVFDDPDGDVLTYTVISSDPGVVMASVSGTTLTLTETGLGTANITVTALDAAFNVNDQFQVTVQDVNDPPTVINPIPDLNRNEGFQAENVNLSNVFSDPDMDPLTFTAVSSNTGVVTVSVAGSVLTITEQGIGNADITVTASDGSLSASDLFAVAVGAVNKAPVVVQTISNRNYNEGFVSRTIDLTNVFDDPDNDPLTLSASSDNTGVVTVGVTNTTLTITEAGTGTSTITVTANDGALSTNTFFEVTVNKVNDPPVVDNPVADLELDEHFLSRNIDLTNVFSDPDADELSITATSSDENVVLAYVTGNTLTLTEVGPGVATVTVTASDGSLSVQDQFTVTINDVNDPPVVDNPVQDVDYLEGFGTEQIDLANVFSDPENNPITLSASSGNTDVVTVSVDGTTLTVTEAGTGIAAIIVTASDGLLTTNDTFDITVINENDPPEVINPIPDKEYVVTFGNHTLNLSNTFSDPDDDALTYTAASTNESVIIAEVNGVTLNLTVVGTGSATITVTASDEAFNVNDEFVVNVVEENLLRVLYGNRELADLDTITIRNEAGSIDLRIRSDVSWSAVRGTTSFWITLTVANDSTLRVNYSREPNNQDRWGWIDVEDNQGHKLSVNLYQTINTGLSDRWTKNGFRLYPNPVEEILNINLSGLENRNVLVEVLDPGGRIMHQKNYQFNRHDLIYLDVSQYIGGLYFVRISDGTDRVIMKFIKE